MDEQDNKKDGLIEDGKRAAKGTIKKAIKAKILSIVWVIIGFITPVLLLFAAILIIMNVVGSVFNIFQKDDDFFTLDTDGAILIKDEQIDAIIASLTELGIDIKGLYLMGDVDYNNPNVQERNQEALRKYIRKFYEAQAVTQIINTKPDWLEEMITSIQAKKYGAVYLYRTNSQKVDAENQGTQMKYVTYEEMLKLKENVEKRIDANGHIVNVSAISDKFSIKDGKLVIASWETEIVKKDGKMTSDKIEVTLLELDYKTAISQYTTPMSFLIYLTTVSQNPEFASAVADLIMRSRIELTVMDGQTVNEEENHYVCTKHTKTKHKNEDGSVDYRYSSESIDTTTVRKTTTIRPTLAITYVKTWFCEQRITYNKKEEVLEPMITVDGPHDEEEPKGAGSWKTGETTTITVNVTKERYQEGVRGDVIDKTGEKGSQGLNLLGKVDENTTFIGLMDNNFRIPNTNGVESPAKRIIDDSGILLDALQRDESLQNMELIMRYILYKYTGDDYGVTSLDFSIFDAKKFNTVNGGSSQLLIEYIHYWEHSSPPPTSADGTKYIVEKDPNGNPVVGYGVDINARKSVFIAAGYSIEIGTEIDKEFVDQLEREIVSDYTSYIESAVSGLNLEKYQINALISRAYNCGKSGAINTLRGSPALNFVDSYKKYWNKETDDKFEKQDSNADFSHNLYVQYMSKPTTGDGKYLAGLERRRKSEWTLFQTGYYDVLGEWHAEGGKIIEIAKSIHEYMEEHQYTYCVYGGNEYEECSKYGKSHGLNTTFEKSKTGYKNTCCATYVSWVLQEAGYISESEHQDGANNLANLLVSKDFIIIKDKSELQPGDILCYNSHIEIYAGDGTVYNAGSGPAIRNSSPQTKSITGMTMALRAPY